MVEAMGTSQRQPRRPAQNASAAATGARSTSGPRTQAHSEPTPALETSEPIQSAHRLGAPATAAITKDTSAIAAVEPMAIASARHSRRATNQNSPTPGVTLVSRTNAHAAGQRNPATIATAISASMFPRARSRTTNPVSRTAGSHHRTTATSAAPFRRYQAARNHVNGSASSGAKSWRNAGEYRYAMSPPRVGWTSAEPRAALQ